MTSGSEDLTHLRNVSFKLLTRAVTIGRLPTPNLSLWLEKMRGAGQTEGLTSYCHHDRLRATRSEESDSQRAMRLAGILDRFSTSELVELDRRGIRICLPTAKHNLNDRSWAYDNE